MSRVDFYVLSEDGPDARLRCACRLAEKAVEQGHRVYMRTGSSSEAQRLDDLLWTFSDRGFLPHEIRDGNAPSHPLVRIALGTGAAPPSHRQLLINLSDSVPADLESFESVAEIVDVDIERKRLSRERYKHYRERGCALETHNV